MMRRPTGLVIGALGLLLLARPAVADGDPAPFEAMRSLQSLQDRIATGDAVALAAHNKAILRTARAFAAAKASTWHETRNTRALIVYLFSGGNAAAIESAIPRAALAPGLEPLYAGALAYGLGDDVEARTRLLPIDPKTQPSALGGHLALVQATLVAPDDPKKAIALLDVARLLEPGTLVEEAALRKELSLLGATDDLDKFALLSRRYLAGFRRSIYADNFRQLVAQVAAQVGAGDTDAATTRLGKLLGSVDQDERRRLYLAIAREALVSGRTTMAALAGEEAARLARHGEPDEARAKLYYGAAIIVDNRYDLGLKALSEVAPARLVPRDRALRSSAMAVAAMIREAAVNGKSELAKGQSPAAIVADAERSLAAADALLKDPEK